MKTTIFGTTQYSLIELVKQGGEAGRWALGEWYKIYRSPMRQYIVRRFPGLSNQADELVDAFIHKRVLEGRFFDHYVPDPQKRFRSYLKTSLIHHCISVWRHEGRRGGPAFSLDEEFDAPDSTGPDNFDSFWARQVLAQAIRRVRSNCAHGKSVTKNRAWGVLEARFLRPLRGKPVMDYTELVHRYDVSSPKIAQKAATQGKRMLADAIRSIVSQYPGSHDTESEIRDLLRILPGQKAPARLWNRRHHTDHSGKEQP